MAQFYMPFRPAYDGNMKVIPGALLWFTLTGTNTPANVYNDEALTTPLSNPVEANGVGRWPTIWMDPAIDYRARVYTPGMVIGVSTPLEEFDPYVGVDAGPGNSIALPIEIGDVAGLGDVLNAKSPVGHNHDDRYYTEAEVTALLGAKQDLSALLLSIATLDLTGKAGQALVVNGAETGFEIADTIGNIVLSTLVWESGGDVDETAPNSTVVGVVGNRTSGSTLSLTDTAGGRFAINSGTAQVTVAGALDFAANPTHNITVREVLAGADNTPNDTVLVVTVNDVAASPLTDPTITQTSASGTNPPEFNVTAADMLLGWVYQIDYTTNGAAPDGTPDNTVTLVEANIWPIEDGGVPVDWGLVGLSVGVTLKWRVRYGPSGGPYSNWSNTLTDIMAAPDTALTVSATQPGATTGGTTTKTINTIDFIAGRALVFLGPGSVATAVTVDGVACTKITNATANVSIWRSNSDITAGNKTIVITAGSTGNFMVGSGTLTNGAGAVTGTGSLAWASQAGNIDTGSITRPTQGIIIGLACGDTATGDIEATGTGVTEKIDISGSHNLCVGTRVSTGNIVFTYPFHNFKGGCWCAIAP